MATRTRKISKPAEVSIESAAETPAVASESVAETLEGPEVPEVQAEPVDALSAFQMAHAEFLKGRPARTGKMDKPRKGDIIGYQNKNGEFEEFVTVRRTPGTSLVLCTDERGMDRMVTISRMERIGRKEWIVAE